MFSMRNTVKYCSMFAVNASILTAAVREGKKLDDFVKERKENGEPVKEPTESDHARAHVISSLTRY